MTAGGWTPPEAKHWGLANHVVPKGQGLAKAREIAQQLADGPPLLFPAIKQLLRHTEWWQSTRIRVARQPERGAEVSALKT